MSMHFPTDSDYLTRLSSNLIDFTNNFTITAWIKRPASWTNSSPYLARISGGGSYTNICYGKDSANKMTFSQAGSATSSNDLAANTWVFFTVRRTSTTNLNIYFDLSLEGTDTTLVSVSGVSDGISIGNSNAAPTGNGWMGDVCQFRIWSTNLSDEELAAEKNSATLVKTANCAASWPLATGTDTSDTSGNNRTLTLVGTPTTGADDPVQGGGATGLMWL